MTTTTATTGTRNAGTIVTQAGFDSEVWVTVGDHIVALSAGQAKALAGALTRAANDASDNS